MKIFQSNSYINNTIHKDKLQTSLANTSKKSAKNNYDTVEISSKNCTLANKNLEYENKLKAIKEKIDSGSYTVDSKEVAKKILKDLAKG